MLEGWSNYDNEIDRSTIQQLLSVSIFGLLVNMGGKGATQLTVCFFKSPHSTQTLNLKGGFIK